MDTMEDGVISLKHLVGMHILSGVELGYCKNEYGNTVGCVKFMLDGNTYLAMENECDGLRSFMDEIKVVEEPCKYRFQDTEVLCRYDGYEGSSNKLLDFVDVKNNKTILTIGTENYDDWYPTCRFTYTPENLHWNDTCSNCTNAV